MANNQLNWSHFRPEISGKPEEDAEARKYLNSLKHSEDKKRESPTVGFEPNTSHLPDEHPNR